MGQTVTTPGFGQLTDYKTVDGKKQVIRKVLDTSQISSFQPHFHIMNRLVKLFPSEFARVSNYHRLTGSYSLIEPNKPSHSLYFEDSAVDLDKVSQYLREAGEHFTEQDVEAVLGFFVMAGLTMEENLAFHPAVTPQNVLLLDCKLALYNPLIYDGFVPRWLQQIVDPISRYGNSWSQDWTTSLARREAQAVKEGPRGTMRLILDNHRELLQLTIQRMFASLLSLTALAEVDPNDPAQVSRAATASYNHYSKGLVDFLLAVLGQRVASFKQLEAMVAKARSSVLRSFSFNVMTSNSLREDPASLVQEAAKAIQAGRPEDTEYFSVLNAHNENDSFGQNQSLQSRNPRLNRTLPIFDELPDNPQAGSSPNRPVAGQGLQLGKPVQTQSQSRNQARATAPTNGSSATVTAGGQQQAGDTSAHGKSLLQQRFDPRGTGNQPPQASPQTGVQQQQAFDPLMSNLARLASDPRQPLAQHTLPNQSALPARDPQPNQSSTQQQQPPQQPRPVPPQPAAVNQQAGLQRPPPPPNFNQNNPVPSRPLAPSPITGPQQPSPLPPPQTNTQQPVQQDPVRPQHPGFQPAAQQRPSPPSHPHPSQPTGPASRPQPPSPTNYKPYLEHILAQQQETLQQLRDLQRTQAHLSLEQKKELEQLQLLQDTQRRQGQEIGKLAQIQTQIEELARDHGSHSMDLLSSQEYLQLLEEKELLDAKINAFLSNGNAAPQREPKRRPTVSSAFSRDRLPAKRTRVCPPERLQVPPADQEEEPADAYPRPTAQASAWSGAMQPAQTLQSDSDDSRPQTHSTDPQRHLSRLISEDIRNGCSPRDAPAPADPSLRTRVFSPARPLASRTLQAPAFDAQASQRFVQASPRPLFAPASPHHRFEGGQPAKRILATNIYTVPNDSPPLVSSGPQTHTLVTPHPMTRAVRILQPTLRSSPLRVSASLLPDHQSLRPAEPRVATVRSSFSFPTSAQVSTQRLLHGSALRSSSLAPAADSSPQLRRLSPQRPVTRTVHYPPASHYSKL